MSHRVLLFGALFVHTSTFQCVVELFQQQRDTTFVLLPKAIYIITSFGLATPTMLVGLVYESAKYTGKTPQSRPKMNLFYSNPGGELKTLTRDLTLARTGHRVEPISG